MNKPLRIMMVAGEHSGDILGAGLIKQLKVIYPKAVFSGIGGPRMLNEGFNSYYPMSTLSVFGLFEVLKHLPELLSIRRQLRHKILAEKPDVFIGIDAPDFNLKLERDLHQQGIKTVHYVSPTVWAWRPKRIKKLIGSLDALLCIFPFEETYYQQTLVPGFFIGHPLADQYEQPRETEQAKKTFNIRAEKPVLTMMPGSRLGEIERHAPVFLNVAKVCSDQIPELNVLVPMPDQSASDLFLRLYNESGIELDLEVQVLASTEMIAASDIVLVASGTATLEVMLLQKPMVVAYKLSPLTSWVFKTFNLLKAPFVSMPNLISGKAVVKELLQDEVTVDNLSAEVMALYRDKKACQTMIEEFGHMKTKLTCHADAQAARIVSRVIEGEITA